MKFGIGIDPLKDSAEIIRLVKLAEDSGFEYAWIADHPDNELYKLLQTILLETESIKIGPGVTNPFIRKPGKLSIELMNLNRISENRIILGMGPGNKNAMDTQGIAWEKPFTTLKKSANAINDMNSKNPSHKVPIYIEASSPRLLELSGKIADGALINASHPKDFENITTPIEKGLESSERNSSDFDIIAYSATSLGTDCETAKNAARIVVAFIIAGSTPHKLERHGISKQMKNDIYLCLSKGDIGGALRYVTDDFVDEFSIAGTSSEIIPKIKDLEKKGVAQYVASAPIGSETEESIKLFSDVISSY